MANIKIKTKGMHCTSCEILLKEALEETEGVNKVEVSYKTGIVSVDYDAKKINQGDILEIIEIKGYEVE